MTGRVRSSGDTDETISGGSQDRRIGDPLVGCVLPWITLDSWPNGPINVRRRWCPQRPVIFCMCATAQDEPGGTGLLEQLLRAWVAQASRLRALNYEIAFLSAAPLSQPHERVQRSVLPYVLLSDEEMRLAAALPLPTAHRGGVRSYAELMFASSVGTIDHVFHTAFAPVDDVGAVLETLERPGTPKRRASVCRAS